MSKSGKSTLKEAREHLDKKNYKDTLRICKRVLKEDRNNYNALLLLSAAMREVEDLKSQAPLALKKATEIQPDNPLAWRGLVAYYENEPENASGSELISAYCKLLRFDRDSAKYQHFLAKCTELLLLAKDDAVLGETLSCFRMIRDSFVETRDEKLGIMDVALVSILTQYPKLPNDYDDLLESVLASSVKKDVEKKQDHYRRYLKILYKLQKYDVLLTEASIMHDVFPNDTYPLEWICRTYSEQTILHGEKDFDGAKFYETLLSLNKTSIFALLAKAAHLYNERSFIESRNILNYIVSTKVLLHAWVLLGEVNLKLYCWEQAENACLKAQQLVAGNESLSTRINLNLLESMTKSNKKHKWQLAAQKFSKLLNSDVPKNLLFLARAHILTDNSEAVNILDRLDNYPDLKLDTTILRAMFLKKQGKFEQAADVLDLALSTSEAWLLLGQIHWELSDFGHSLMAFLKGVHADPNNWECLVYLGNYYKEHGDDLERSKKCYQKALQINPSADDAGIGLSTVYRLLKDDEANVQLLRKLTVDGNGPKWAWLQLGLQKLENNDPHEAVKALRCGIRVDPNDSHCWETLADAYFARGAYTSAIKSYQRTLELRPDSFYSLLQVANIKLLLSQYEDAKEDFERVIREDEENVAGLKGLAETHLGLARSETENQLLARARDDIQMAVDYLITAIAKRSEFSCLWKLLGNASHLMAKMPRKFCYLRVPPALAKLESADESTEIQQGEVLRLSVRCYCRALNISKDSSLLWHDLAVANLTQLRLDPSLDPEDAIGRCVSAAKHAIRLCPTSWIHWNLLGVICMSPEIMNYALAQHCFVMAVDLEHDNAIPWSNLGSLYLLLDDLYRANQAFSWAQRVDPAYVNSWVGQAIIAEKVSSREAMDLFRHTTQLSYSSQGAIGYAHWVLATLLDPEAKKDPSHIYSIVNMYPVQVATDYITWYIAHFPDDACALNACGLLLERQKLYRSAEEHFSAALENAKGDKKTDAVAVNLARILVHLGNYEKAIKLCQSIKSASFKSHCQLALALFKAERYEESYSAYEVTLEWLADANSDKAHVLCAMAAMAYMFESVDDVKTLLFQCIEFKPRVVAGLLAAAALGLLHDDQNLAALILKELKVFQDHEEYRHHIALLSAYSVLKQNGVGAAIRALVKIVHRHPGDARLWTHLVRFLFSTRSKDLQCCARKALFLGRDVPELCITQVASLAVFSDLMKNPDDLRSTLKSVHAYPASIETWANLVVTLLPKCRSPGFRPSAHWLTVLTAVARREFSKSEEMSRWLMSNEKLASQIADEMSVAAVS